MHLTTQQHAILEFIGERIRIDGFPPTQLEICYAFGFTQNAAANYHLRALEAAGEITRTSGAARSIRLRKKKPRSASKPHGAGTHSSTSKTYVTVRNWIGMTKTYWQTPAHYAECQVTATVRAGPSGASKCSGRCSTTLGQRKKSA